MWIFKLNTAWNGTVENAKFYISQHAFAVSTILRREIELKITYKVDFTGLAVSSLH